MLAYSGRELVFVQLRDVTHFCEGMDHVLRIAAPKNCVVEYDLGTELPAISADPVQMRQLTMNVILNVTESLEGENGVICVGLTSGILIRNAWNMLP